MREEESVLKEIYKFVKGDASPVHLPVSPVTISHVVGLPVDRVLACCKVLENHGYLNSISGKSGPVYFYITKMGISAALNPNLSLYIHSLPTSARKRV